MERGPESVAGRSSSPFVVHLIPQLRLGAGRYVVDIALAQVREGWRVRVAVAADAGAEWQSDPRLIRELRNGGVGVLEAGDFFHRRSAGLLAAAQTLRVALSGERCDSLVAHAHTAMAAAVARWAGAAAVVATCHGWNLPRSPEFTLQDALAFGLADAVTSPSAHWAQTLQRELGVGPVSVIPVGLDLRRCPSPPRKAVRPGPPRLVCVAELTPRKGIGDLLEAMPIVWRQTPEAELHLFGDGDARSGLEARAAEIGAGRRVVFHGFVQGPYARLHEFDLFCLPSHSDNLPVALMEAMLARLPVLSTNVGGIPELVLDAPCGEIVPPADPAALAAGVLRLLALPPDERARLGETGEQFVRRRCAIEVTVRQILDVYAEAARRHCTARSAGVA